MDRRGKTNNALPCSSRPRRHLLRVKLGTRENEVLSLVSSISSRTIFDCISYLFSQRKNTKQPNINHDNHDFLEKESFATNPRTKTYRKWWLLEPRVWLLSSSTFAVAHRWACLMGRMVSSVLVLALRVSSFLWLPWYDKETWQWSTSYSFFLSIVYHLGLENSLVYTRQANIVSFLTHSPLFRQTHWPKTTC